MCSLHSMLFHFLLTKTMHIYRILGYIACKLQTTFGFAATLSSRYSVLLSAYILSSWINAVPTWFTCDALVVGPCPESSAEFFHPFTI